MTFAQRRYRLTTHFSERIPDVKWRISVHHKWINREINARTQRDRGQMDRNEQHQSRENEKQRKRIKGNCSGNMPTKPYNTSSFSLDSYPLKDALHPDYIFTITTYQHPKNRVQTISVSPYPSNGAALRSPRGAMSPLMCMRVNQSLSKVTEIFWFEWKLKCFDNFSKK
jgi:hypothetical protein